MQKNNFKPHIFRKILAYFFDYFFILGFTFWYIYEFGTVGEDGVYSVNGLLTFGPILFWFLFTVIFEQILGGTLGNLIVDLRPFDVNDMTSKPSFKQSVLRHLFDPFDALGIGVFVIYTNEKRQRLGDLVANTIVIKTPYKK